MSRCCAPALGRCGALVELVNMLFYVHAAMLGKAAHGIHLAEAALLEHAH
jgi:hypothetical protein